MVEEVPARAWSPSAARAGGYGDGLVLRSGGGRRAWWSGFVLRSRSANVGSLAGFARVGRNTVRAVSRGKRLLPWIAASARPFYPCGMSGAIAALQSKRAELAARLAEHESQVIPIRPDPFHLDAAIAILRGGDAPEMRA